MERSTVRCPLARATSNNGNVGYVTGSDYD